SQRSAWPPRSPPARKRPSPESASATASRLRICTPAGAGGRGGGSERGRSAGGGGAGSAATSSGPGGVGADGAVAEDAGGASACCPQAVHASATRINGNSEGSACRTGRCYLKFCVLSSTGSAHRDVL